MPLLFSGETLIPMACGALFWPAHRALLVADLHLEKASHFARRGWPLPPYDSETTLARLEVALAATGAETVMALGDSFHDSGGPERLPAEARAALDRIAARTQLVWITGNHDDAAAARLHGTAHIELAVGALMLRHEADPHDSRPEISGHFHPKMTVRHRGRAISRRCFALGSNKLILPAYGSLAGGLDVGDPAFAAASPGPLTALVAEGERLLRFPVSGLAA